MLGKSVSHYRILRQLGAGGMGVVYEAEDTRLRRNVALKFLSADLAQDAPMLERFEREARAASALNHPGICTVHAIEQHERDVACLREVGGVADQRDRVVNRRRHAADSTALIIGRAAR